MKLKLIKFGSVKSTNDEAVKLIKKINLFHVLLLQKNKQKAEAL